ncbi:MAG: phosphatidylserine decarboxylase [Planctomycetes bacterium]|nr:phosphatidylserine decarboxylase [Planctomycetota bacterium]
MSTPLRYRTSLVAGWMADRKIPRFLRAPIYRTYARLTGANLEEARGPLHIYPSLGQYFVRELKPGLRPIDPDPKALVSPVDGTVQDVSRIEKGTILQAKGHPYAVSDLLGGVQGDVDLEGGHAWTVYLGPKDYHRIHAPCAGDLTHARWIQGCRYSVQPRVLARRMVLPINERCPLRIETPSGPLFLVLVGAVIVGRIRVVGLPPDGDRVLDPPRPLESGQELARFEMGSTIVLVAPPGGPTPLKSLTPGQTLRLGEAIGHFV